jgi:hypothetical protein
MSSQTKNILTIAVGIVVGYVALRFILHLAFSLLMGLVPIALIGGGIYIAYQVFGKKALGGGRRTLP